MYSVVFDLVVVETEKHHRRGIIQAYTEIGAVLGEHGFRRVQGSLYVADNEDMANLFLAMQSLRSRAWLPKRCGISGPSASNSGRISRSW
jgi:virulence-associated protein VapD